MVSGLMEWIKPQMATVGFNNLPQAPVVKMWILYLAVLLHLVCPAATTCSLVIMDENAKVCMALFF